MSVFRFQRCTCPCYRDSVSAALSQTATRRSSDFAGQRVDLAVGRTEFRAPLIHKLNSHKSVPSTTRCVYSPLVENYESSKINPIITKRDGGPTLTSPSSISFLPVEDIVDEGSFQRSRNEKGAVPDGKFPLPQDPVAAAHGDPSLLVTGSDVGRDLGARRSARYQPQTMSLTQGFRFVANQGVSCAIGVAGRPIANATKIGGPTGLMMGLAVAGLGIATAIQKVSEPHSEQKLCSRCDGYGVERCDVCAGAGKITWEGKVHRTNPCPRCFGSRLKKCPRCDGCRVKKDSAPVLLMMKTPPKEK